MNLQQVLRNADSLEYNIGMYKHLLQNLPIEYFSKLKELNDLVYSFNYIFEDIIGDLFVTEQSYANEMKNYYSRQISVYIPTTYLNNDIETPFVNQLNYESVKPVQDTSIQPVSERVEQFLQNVIREQNPIPNEKKGLKRKEDCHKNTFSKRTKYDVVECKGYFDESRKKHYSSKYCDGTYQTIITKYNGSKLKLICCPNCFADFGKNYCKCGILKSKQFSMCKTCNKYSGKCKGGYKGCLGSCKYHTSYCASCRLNKSS
jgi:hypothetical protein